MEDTVYEVRGNAARKKVAILFNANRTPNRWFISSNNPPFGYTTNWGEDSDVTDWDVLLPPPEENE